MAYEHVPSPDLSLVAEQRSRCALARGDADRNHRNRHPVTAARWGAGAAARGGTGAAAGGSGRTGGGF